MFILILDSDAKAAWHLFRQVHLIGAHLLQLGQTILQYETETGRIMIESILVSKQQYRE